MTTMSKSEFAAHVGRAPSAVSNWIAEGKLFGPALEGEGRKARINVSEALSQLRGTLDVSQQMAQSRPIGPAAFVPPVPRPKRLDEVLTPAADDSHARIAKAKAEREELALQRERDEEKERRGLYMQTAAVRDAWSQQIAALIQGIETGLVTAAASAVAAEIGGNPREVARVLKDWFREHRQRIAEAAAAEAAAEPEHLTDDEEEDDPDDVADAED